MFDRDFSQKIVDFQNFEFSQLGEALGFGGLMLLIGMATVFAVLLIIWVCLTLFKIGFHDLPEKKKAASAAADVPAPVIVSEPEENDDCGEIIAAIAAAIAMAEAESDGIKFKVVSFRRK